ncbi:DNA mismatch endonuclease (patch repair protein) [Dermacoccus sp. GAS27A]
MPGAPRRSIDIAFTRARLAIFIDGCYWHGCPQHSTAPRNNTGWWQDKFAANAARDADTNRLLVERGWTVMRVWEHEDPDTVASRVLAALHG